MHRGCLATHIGRVVNLMWIVLASVACQQSRPMTLPTPTLPSLAANPLPVPLPETSPNTGELPKFLEYLNDGWRGLIFQSEMASTLLWANLDVATLTELDSTFVPEEADWAEHVTFLIDDHPESVRLSHLPSKEDVRTISLLGEFDLEPDIYEAAVEVKLPSGITLEHRWFFTVVPGLIWQGLPQGVYVAPLPESTISLAEYERGVVVPSRYKSCSDGGICLGLETSEIVERGEILACEDVIEKVRLVSLDRRSPISEDDEVVEITGECLLERMVETDASGREVTSYPGPYVVQSWKIDLSVGEHIAVGELTRASGQMEKFAWRFTIVEDD